MSKGMTTSCDINSLFINMALMFTFPYFVHIPPATNIQRDEQADRRHRSQNIISGRNWKLEVGEIIQHLMMKRTYAEHESLQPKGTLFALSSS